LKFLAAEEIMASLTDATKGKVSCEECRDEWLAKAVEEEGGKS
jgi:hypothetical protein